MCLSPLETYAIAYTISQPRYINARPSTNSISNEPNIIYRSHMLKRVRSTLMVLFTHEMTNQLAYSHSDFLIVVPVHQCNCIFRPFDGYKLVFFLFDSQSGNEIPCIFFDSIFSKYWVYWLNWFLLSIIRKRLYQKLFHSLFQKLMKSVNTLTFIVYPYCLHVSLKTTLKLSYFTPMVWFKQKSHQ